MAAQLTNKIMFDRIKNIWNNIPGALKNKYFLTFFVFVVWILLFDPNNLLDRFNGFLKIEELENEKEYYFNKIEEENTQLNEIKTNKESIEKFAREKYLMKKKDEDIFIIVEEEEEKK